jgi:hypothetical protein
MATGENTGTWGNVTNENLGTALEQAIVESATITFASANQTLTLTDSNARQDARALRLNLTGTTGGARDLIVPAIQKPYLVNNGTADTITVKVSGQTGIAVPAGKSMLLYNNGTDVGLAFNRVVADLVGNGSAITAMNASEITTGSLANARTTASSSNGASTIVARDASGNFSANVITANGSSITGINAANISAGTLPEGRGGTGETTYTNGQLLIGSTPDGGLTKATLTAGTGITITNGAGSITVAASGAGGFSGSQGFNSPGTWTAPPTTTRVFVMLQAGGGGGGGASPQGPVGGNGGAGGAAWGVVTVTGGSPYPVTVGAAGTGGTSSPAVPNFGNAGGGGGASSFSNLISANGGGAGNAGGPAAGNPGAGGNGVAPTGIGFAGAPGRTLNTAQVGGGGIFAYGSFSPESYPGNFTPGRVLAQTGGGGVTTAGPSLAPTTVGAAGFVFIAF